MEPVTGDPILDTFKIMHQWHTIHSLALFLLRVEIDEFLILVSPNETKTLADSNAHYHLKIVHIGAKFTDNSYIVIMTNCVPVHQGPHNPHPICHPQHFFNPF